jgi:hypothetical protein
LRKLKVRASYSAAGFREESDPGKSKNNCSAASQSPRTFPWDFHCQQGHRIGKYIYQEINQLDM